MMIQILPKEKEVEDAEVRVTLEKVQCPHLHPKQIVQDRLQ